MPRGPLFIVSGPSGSGKSTLIRQLLKKGGRPLRLSVSATTRSARPGEHEGVDYYYWTRDLFEAAIARGEFLEYARVHENYYGTLAREVEPYRAAGLGVILDIDTQGAKQVWAKVDDHISVFVQTSSLDEYEKRLRQRGTEDEPAIRRRLDNARTELSLAGAYHYQILNDRLDEALARLEEVIDRSFGDSACSKI